MAYTNKSELLALLKRENLWANKDISQNFLVNFKVIEKIIRAADLSPDDNVVEVGPGLGILTRELAKHVSHVHAIELDRDLIPILQKELTTFSNINLEQGNALKARLPNINYKLVANIPYHITSPLLQHFLNPKNPEEKRPTLIVLLIQKEVADKICAQDGKHNILSLQTQIFGKPSIVGKVPPTDFYPQPKVESAIIKIEVYPEPLIKDFETFHRIISAAFHQKRKTLLNSISSMEDLSREQTEQLLKKANIDPQQRPQHLSIEEWKRIITSPHFALDN
jgi:16S rRNA (adenine1518-N6/adenine1519-N6)-dimethyltransferase